MFQASSLYTQRKFKTNCRELTRAKHQAQMDYRTGSLRNLHLRWLTLYAAYSTHQFDSAQCQQSGKAPMSSLYRRWNQHIQLKTICDRSRWLQHWANYSSHSLDSGCWNQSETSSTRNSSGDSKADQQSTHLSMSCISGMLLLTPRTCDDSILKKINL